MDAKSAARVFAQRFEPVEQVGCGGMGTVFRSRDRHRNDWVALKLLTAEVVKEAEVERFLREARLLSELKHPGIVGYVDHGLAPDGRPYLAMEWLEGEDLAQRLRRGPLTLGEALTLLQKVCSALSVAHEAGVVHRDRSPKTKLCLRNGHLALHRRRADRAFLPFVSRWSSLALGRCRTHRQTTAGRGRAVRARLSAGREQPA
jgi:hypothetical protein